MHKQQPHASPKCTKINTSGDGTMKLSRCSVNSTDTVKTRGQDCSLNHDIYVGFALGFLSVLLSIYFTPFQHLIRSYCPRHQYFPTPEFLQYADTDPVLTDERASVSTGSWCETRLRDLFNQSTTLIPVLAQVHTHPSLQKVHSIYLGAAVSDRTFLH